MAIRGEGKIVVGSFGWAQHWLGRSGRSYGLIPQNFDSFSMVDDELYLIAKGSHVLWVGSTTELIGDPLSRTRFRLALDCGDRSFRLDNAHANGERLTTIWDLEGGELQTEAVAA